MVIQDQEPFQFAAIQRLTNNEIALRLIAPGGYNYRVDAQTNILDWSALVTLPASSSVNLLQYTDSAAPYLNARFYRAMQLAETDGVIGDHLATTNGDVIIQARYHATFVMSCN